jgi:hypothetical protein
MRERGEQEKETITTTTTKKEVYLDIDLADTIACVVINKVVRTQHTAQRYFNIRG